MVDLEVMVSPDWMEWKERKGVPDLAEFQVRINFTITGIVEEVYYTLFQDIYAAWFFFLIIWYL